MNIGLYFGSFNPIHTGHLIIANYVLEQSGLDKIWFVVSPQNPLKKTATLLNEYDRLYLTQLAIEGNNKFRVSNVEFHLPKPSYTIDTLAYLTEKFPLENFSIIMGSDSYRNLSHWKNYEQILERFKIFVYLRPEFPVIPSEIRVGTTVLKAPLLDISASYIRKRIKEGKSIKYLTPDAVEEYIIGNKYYRK